MTHYDVYLEINEAGHCMAHIPELPGCLVRAENREAVEAALPEAITEYHGWLRRHGEEVAESLSDVTWEIAAVVRDAGPFDPGDTATLFDWERQPLRPVEMERTFQLAAYQHEDLLALVRSLSRSVRRWQAGPEQMSIDRILRHIGNAEQWYVSRLVPPDTLPAQWADDADMPLFRFLKMTRETAMARLRQLTDEELAQVCYPQVFTDHPDEPWTARKVMRRLLEHEREHIDHILELLIQWRRRLLARIAAERANFLWQLRGVDESTLSQYPVTSMGTAKDMLVHVAAWDALHTERISMVLAGRIDEIPRVGGSEAMAARNEEIRRRYQDISPEHALAMFLKERGGFLAMLNRLTEEELHRQIKMPWEWRTRIRVWAKWRYGHDAAHANDLISWRNTLPVEARRAVSPMYVTRAILNASRNEFLTVAALIPDSQRESRQVCGIWTLKDLIGHLTDWELVAVDGLRQLAAGQQPEFDAPINDFDDFNNAHAAVRRHQPWDEVWQEFHDTRQSLLDLLSAISDEDFSRPFVAPWGQKITPYQWTMIWPGHEREHAIDVRQALQLNRLPKRLWQHAH